MTSSFSFKPARQHDSWASYFREYREQRDAHFNPEMPEEYGVTVLQHYTPLTPDLLKGAARALWGQALHGGWAVKAGQSMTLETRPPFASGARAGQPRPDLESVWVGVIGQKGKARFQAMFLNGRWKDAIIEEPILGRELVKVKSDFMEWMEIF